MATVSLLLSLILLPGALAVCTEKSNLFITAPKMMEALNGSCLIIPCNFSFEPKDLFISTGNLYGVWIKNDYNFGKYPNNVIYSSSGTVTTYPMNITGNLTQTNCTTLFSDLITTHTDTYYFRIDGSQKATAVCDPLRINVRDAPGSPTLNISGDLRENVSVTITCSASTPCPHLPPKLTWNLQAEPDNHREENTDGTFTTKIQKTITLSDKHHGLTINCSASYPVTEGIKTAKTQQTLNVSYAPKDTSASISPSAVVSAGTWVNLSCSSRARPTVSCFTWFQISSDGARTNVSEGAFYTFNATGGGVYYCVASNGLGAQASPQIHLTVTSVESVLLWEPVVGGILGIIALICLILCIWRLKSTQTVQQTQVFNVNMSICTDSDLDSMQSPVSVSIPDSWSYFKSLYYRQGSSPSEGGSRGHPLWRDRLHRAQSGPRLGSEPQTAAGHGLRTDPGVQQSQQLREHLPSAKGQLKLLQCHFARLVQSRASALL
ncbi:sialoadhesin-like [Betta splendens]|uniref:Sialoadhesin-like n=1 Tax=Betta splendens TaxID=158456 RepID=A0A6P7MCW8_BETSP|nr:sialoadhesin-like [Betta splendens]